MAAGCDVAGRPSSSALTLAVDRLVEVPGRIPLAMPVSAADIAGDLSGRRRARAPESGLSRRRGQVTSARCSARAPATANTTA